MQRHKFSPSRAVTPRMSLMSETAASEAQQLMGLDTVRIKSPYMARNIVDKVKAQGQSYCHPTHSTRFRAAALRVARPPRAWV